MAFRLSAKLRQRHGSKSLSIFKVTSLYTCNISMFLGGGHPGSILIIIELNKYIFCESYRQSIHRMMPMVISLSPVRYFFDLSPIFVLKHLYHTKLFIFRQIQFFHKIHKLPILTQFISYGTSSSHHSATNFIQHSKSFLGDILRVPLIPIDKSFRNIFLFHF